MAGSLALSAAAILLASTDATDAIEYLKGHRMLQRL
jgi:hypothetical protein